MLEPEPNDLPRVSQPEQESPSLASRLLAIVRALLLWSTLAYGFALVAGLCLMRLVGEKNSLLNFALFIPPLVWLLPLAVLAPFGLLLKPRLLWLHALLAFFVLVPFMRFRWHMATTPPPADLICITNNIAQNHDLSLVPFIEREHADVVALQDSRVDGPPLIAKLPEWNSAVIDQFTLLSRHPIISKTPCHLANESELIAARFEVATPHGKVAIYNTRMPTPRHYLNRARYWLGMVRRDPLEINDRKLWHEYADSLPSRLVILDRFRAQLRRETLPYLVMGDFNTPGTGRTQRLFSEEMTDCFDEVGLGYGFTFPSDQPHWMAAYGPWLRLDYIFSSNAWEPLYCRVETDRNSEHRALVAGLRLRKTGN